MEAISNNSAVEKLAFPGNPNFEAPAIVGQAFLSWDGRISIGPGIIKSSRRDSRTPALNVPSGTILKINESLTSPGYILIMQSDGNLVFSRKEGVKLVPLWSTKTGGQCSSCLAAFQGDGNVVIYEIDPSTGAATRVIYRCA